MFGIYTENETQFVVEEIKQKNNAFLSNYREMVPYLLNHLFYEKSINVFISNYESEQSKIYRLNNNKDTFVSINQIINEKFNTLIDTPDFYDYDEYANEFNHEKILKAIPLYEAHINQDKFSDFAQAIKINVSNISNKEITLLSKKITISDCHNINLNINDINRFSIDKSEFIFENLNNCNIYTDFNSDNAFFFKDHLFDYGSSRPKTHVNKFTRTFIFLNCQNINLIDSGSIEKIILNKDSTIHIKQNDTQNKFKEHLNTSFWDYNSATNDFSFVNNLTGEKKVMFNQSDSINSNDKKLSTAIQLYIQSEQYEETLQKFINTIHVDISNMHKTIKFSNFNIEDSIQNSLKSIMRDDTFIQNLIINNADKVK